MTHVWGSSVECLFLLCEVLTHAVNLCIVIVPERRDKKPHPAPAVYLQAALHEPLSRVAGGDSERGDPARGAGVRGVQRPARPPTAPQPGSVESAAAEGPEWRQCPSATPGCQPLALPRGSLWVETSQAGFAHLV